MSNPTFTTTDGDFWSTMLHVLAFNKEELNKEAERHELTPAHYFSLSVGADPPYTDYRIDRIALAPISTIAFSAGIRVELVVSDKVPAKNPFTVDQDSLSDALRAVLAFNMGIRHTPSLEAGVPPLVFLGNQLGIPNRWGDNELNRSYVALQPIRFMHLGGRRKIGGRLMLDLFTLDD